ncbi:MAG: hypothetical protein H7061_00550 [Bdellovibrionaceae bacterium]|nr:hypothetical protein [Bdellovibrio sp.]
MRIKILISILLIQLVAHGRVKRKPSAIDIKSSEEILFIDKKEAAFSDMGKSTDYAGQLVQLSETSAELMNSDLYKFKNESATQVSVRLCEKYLVELFGTEKKRSLQLKTPIQLIDTAVGKACALQLNDAYEHAAIPFRYVIVGLIHGRATGLVWNLYKIPSESTTAKLQSFWKSLK